MSRRVGYRRLTQAERRELAMYEHRRRYPLTEEQQAERDARFRAGMAEWDKRIAARHTEWMAR